MPRGAWWSIAAVLLTTGCRCGAPSPTVTETPVAHYHEWDGLVTRATRGELGEARIIARDLTGGVQDDLTLGDAGDANAKIGAALGFVAFAEDAEELADAVAAAARGCGMCHATTGALAPTDRPDWAHETAADWAVWGLVWNEALSPPAGGEAVLAQLAESWHAPIAPDTGAALPPEVIRTARVLTACAGCHTATGAGPTP